MPHPERSSDRRANGFAASSPAEAWLMSCSMAGATLALNVVLRWLFPRARGDYHVMRTPAVRACALSWPEMSPS